MEQWLTRSFSISVSMVAIFVVVATGNVGVGGVLSRQHASAYMVATPSFCPATLANDSTPPGERPTPGYHGNGAIWTSLAPNGTILVRPEDIRPDEWIAMKWPWWRGIAGQLFIEGHRLDAPAPALRAETPGGRRLDIPATPKPGVRDGDGPPGFQATELIFPSEGCWKVTAHVGEATLTFVTLVVWDGQSPRNSRAMATTAS